MQSVHDGNMNFLRIWGGSIWPQDAFFDACDELGIMLQQDGIFSDAFYPTDDVFQRNLAAEVTHQVRRLSTHPSVVLYTGGNELYPGGYPAGGGGLAGYMGVIAGTYFGNITANDPSRALWPACPTYPWAEGVDNLTGRRTKDDITGLFTPLVPNTTMPFVPSQPYESHTCTLFWRGYVEYFGKFIRAYGGFYSNRILTNGNHLN